jgi:hypothetical protein
MATVNRIRRRGGGKRCTGKPAAAVLLLAAIAAAAAPHVALGKVESTPEGIHFSYTAPNAGQVLVAGDFNGWSPTAHPMTRDGDVFSTVVKLAAGDHEYKFVVDGQWFGDPDNPVTAGSFGNSLVRVGAKGEILAMEATSNTSLSPKILLNGRFIGLFVGRKDPTNGDRFGVSRPDFNIDLDFGIRMSEALDARMLTKIRNASEGTPLWETSMVFDRGYLDLHRPSWAMRLFDNDTVGTWDDPLHLVGDVGQYSHDYGYSRQGLRATGSWKGVQGSFLLADNFQAGEPVAPPVDTLPVGTPGFRYEYNYGDTNKNTLALRLERDVWPELRLAASVRGDRGSNPGTWSQVTVTSDSTRVRETYARTYERWAGGGADCRYTHGDAWSAFGEVLYGEAYIHPGQGLEQRYRSSGSSWVLAGDEIIEGARVPLDKSARWKLGGAVQPLAGLGLRASLEWERHGLTAAATDSGAAFRNAALVYRGGVDLDLQARWGLPVRLGTDLEVFDFNYARGTPWNTQLWFSYRNFWMEANQDRLPVARYVQLGGDDATTWSPWLEWTVLAGPPLVFRYEGWIRGSEIDRQPLSYESCFKLSYPVTKRLLLYSDTRWVRYDVPVLGMDGGWVSTFAEAAYSFTRDISLAFAFGVDPTILDVVTNEYDAIGRNEFLIGQGATQTVARDRYLNLGSILPRAEQALEDEWRLQVEGIVKF